MKVQHLVEELSEAHIPHWVVVMEDVDGKTWPIYDFKFEVLDGGGFVILSARLPNKEVV